MHHDRVCMHPRLRPTVRHLPLDRVPVMDDYQDTILVLLPANIVETPEHRKRPIHYVEGCRCGGE